MGTNKNSFAKMEELESYKLIVELAQDAIFIKDLESRYVLVNQKTLEAFGNLPREEVIGKNDYELLSPKEAKVKIEDDKKVFTTGKPVEIIKKMTVGNKELYSYAVKTPIKNDKGKIIGLIGIARDITESKKNEDRYRDLIEKEKDIIYTLDDKGNITSSNPAVETILGYRPEELAGKHFMILISKYAGVPHL